jgi:hypothetical protein
MKLKVAIYAKKRWYGEGVSCQRESRLQTAAVADQTGDDDKTVYFLRHPLTALQIHQNSLQMKYFEPSDQIHFVKIPPPPHTAGQAISSLSAITSRWRPSLLHQT